MTQPKIDGYISWLRRNDHFGMTSCIYDDKSQKLLDELFALLEQIAPESPNGVRTLWLRAERGPIEDFGNAAEEIAEGNYDSEEEFVNAWKSWFPEDVKWYHFQAVEDKAEGYRAVAVRHSYVIVQDKRREPAGWPCEISEFVQWLVDGVRSCIEMLKAGTYNDVVRENLPPQHRTGTIRRRDFWNVWPDARADFFKDISPADVTEFIERVSAQEENYAAMKDRLQAMTANDFFRFCAMGYAENNYDGCDKPPREQYALHADGRTIDCRISMRTALRRFMHGSTIENGAVDIRGRSAVAETPRMSICGYWRMAAVIFCIWQELRGTERWKPLNSTSP